MRYLIVLLMITGCATAEQREAEQRAYADALRSQCRGYGFEPQTPQLAQCVMQLDQAVRARQQARNEQGFQQGMGMMNQNSVYRNQPAITCASDGVGGVVCR